MTVTNPSAQAYIAGTGLASSFSFSIVAASASDFEVVYIDTNGTETVLTPSQYSISLNAVAPNQLWSTGGTLTYPISGSPIAAGTSLLIRRADSYTQDTTIRNQGAFYAEAVERGLDQQNMQVQQIAGRTGQIRGAWATGVDYLYGDVVQDGINGDDTQNYYMCVIANTSDVWQDDLAAGYWSLAIDVSAIEQYSIAAAASAAAAAASASSAAGSASSASASALTAAGILSDVEDIQAEINVQAANVSTAEANALAFAVAAFNSAAAASTSESNAAASAATAGTQASNAANSAAAALVSENNAASSAASAASSASAAAGSFITTSSTSNSIGTGAKSFTVGTGVNLAPGQFIVAARTSSPSNYMHGQVTSYAGTSLVMESLDVGGAGTYTDWTITTSSPQGTSGGGSGTVNSGTANYVAYYAGTGTAVSGNANLTMSTGQMTVGQAGSVQGSIRISGSTSGTTTVAAPAAGTGTMTLQSGNDTIVGRATTDTLTNKTIAASSNTLGGVTMTLGSDAQGDIYYRSGAGVLTRLAIGGANTVLHGGSNPSYSAVVEGDITLTDVTTNNVTSTRHGFAPKSPADATLFLNGAATPAFAAVKDSDLSTTDVTANNATTLKHGFLPKLSGSATEFLNGNGTFSVPSATGFQPQQQVFTSSGTFTTSANITTSTRFKFTVTGAGGGGGGVTPLAGVAAGGGGAGSTAIYWVTGLTPSTGYTVTIGAAGTSGSGAGGNGGAGGSSTVVIGVTTVTGGGGSGGLGSSTASQSVGGGAGGTATNGTINNPGGSGGNAVSTAGGNSPSGGNGGASFWGGGGRGANYVNAPQAGQAYGSGGGGGAIAGSGGAGKAGIVLVEWQE